jgi:hypothetical protein
MAAVFNPFARVIWVDAFADHVAAGLRVSLDVALGYEVRDVEAQKVVSKSFPPAAFDFFFQRGEICGVADSMLADLQHPISGVALLDVGGVFVIGRKPQVDGDREGYDRQALRFDAVFGQRRKPLDAVRRLEVAGEQNLIEKDEDAPAERASLNRPKI